MTPDRVSPIAFRRLLTRSVIVPLALLAVLAVVFLGQIMYLLSAAQWVDHTDEVIAKGNLMLRLLVDAESRMRGYLVTGNQVFLDLYQSEEALVGPVFQDLMGMVSDNPPQVERLQVLQTSNVDWQNFARTIMALRHEGKDFMPLAHTMEGKQRMDAMREQVAAFIQLEEGLRDVRSRTAQRATWAIVGISTGLTLLLGGGLAFFTCRQLLEVSASYGNALAEAVAQAESLRKSAHRFEALHEIDLAILAAKSVPELISSALCRMEAVIPSDEAFVLQFDATGRPTQAHFCSAGAKPLAADHACRALTDAGPPEFSDQGDSHVVADLAALGERTPIQDRMLQMGYRSCVTVLLQADGRRLGGLVLAANQPSAFTSEHQEVAEEVSRQLSIAIQQARLREQLQQHADELERQIHERSGDLQESLDGATQRRQALATSDERIEALEQQARDLAWFVETTRQQTLLQSDKKTEALEQKARDLADFVETLRNQTRLQSETEIEALGQKARDLALFVEVVRKETRVKSETEIAVLGQRARDLAVSVESVREKTLLQSDTEIAALGQRARDLAVSVETVREKTLLKSATEIAALGQKARDLAVTVETVREETLLNSDMEIKDLKQQARNLAYRVERSRLETLLESDKVIRKLNEDLEQRVLERTGQLEAANKELESFSYSVSHDLRAPLRAIDGFSRILLEDYAAPLAEEGKNFLNLVRDNTRQMGQLVDDLLAFSRLGRLALAKHTVDPAKIVRLCLAEMKAEQDGRQIEIVIGNLPSCQADPTLLKQVWMNLLSNALKYTRKQKAARIEIGCRTEPRPLTNGQTSPPAGRDTEIVYYVKDNGAGFDMKYAHKLFGVFQRLHRAADYDGTGVGLAIVQRIIIRHGGRVWGEGRLNDGATFAFTLE